MIPLILAALAAVLGLLAGAPWWILALALPAAVPWRLPPALGAVGLVALLPWTAGAAGQLACFAAGVLAAWSALHRLGRAVPWAAVPWIGGAVLLLTFTWGVLPPSGYWADSDVAVRARIAVLAALAVVAAAATYLPRYRNPAPGPFAADPASAALGASGGRDDSR